MRRLCAVCCLAFLNAASYIAFQPTGGAHEQIYERGGGGVQRVLKLLDETPGRLIVNAEVIDSIDAVTTVDGTECCAVHTFELYERGRYRR